MWTYNNVPFLPESLPFPLMSLSGFKASARSKSSEPISQNKCHYKTHKTQQLNTSKWEWKTPCVLWWYYGTLMASDDQYIPCHWNLGRRIHVHVIIRRDTELYNRNLEKKWTWSEGAGQQLFFSLTAVKWNYINMHWDRQWRTIKPDWSSWFTEKTISAIL